MNFAPLILYKTPINLLLLKFCSPQFECTQIHILPFPPTPCPQIMTAALLQKLQMCSFLVLGYNHSFSLGISLAETYCSHNLDKNMYNNKKVMVLGAGNAGYEVANHLAGNASILHVISGEQPIKMAWDTHFVGKNNNLRYCCSIIISGEN